MTRDPLVLPLLPVWDRVLRPAMSLLWALAEEPSAECQVTEPVAANEPLVPQLRACARAAWIACSIALWKPEIPHDDSAETVPAPLFSEAEPPLPPQAEHTMSVSRPAAAVSFRKVPGTRNGMS